MKNMISLYKRLLS